MLPFPPLALSINAHCIVNVFGLIFTCRFFVPLEQDLSSFQSFTSFLFSLVDEHCRPEYHPTHMVLRPSDQVLTQKVETFANPIIGRQVG